MNSNPQLQELVERISNTKKYRDLGIPQETLVDILERELASAPSSKVALKEAKRKLHNILASYLGDPDYVEAVMWLEDAFAAGDPGKIKQVCTQILMIHASTRERMPILEDFYPRLFAVTGIPCTILDLACALHPLSFPWMNLPGTVRYHAYDIHQPRVEFLNRYFTLQGLEPLAEVRDILVDPPAIRADVAFFFKEAHRFEKRRRNCNQDFWRSINSRWVLVSLPTESLGAHHDLVPQHRALVQQAIAGESWEITEVIFENEMVFCIDKGSTPVVT